jgi:hypothetical protein
LHALAWELPNFKVLIDWGGEDVLDCFIIDFEVGAFQLILSSILDSFIYACEDGEDRARNDAENDLDLFWDVLSVFHELLDDRLRADHGEGLARSSLAISENGEIEAFHELNEGEFGMFLVELFLCGGHAENCIELE